MKKIKYFEQKEAKEFITIILKCPQCKSILKIKEPFDIDLTWNCFGVNVICKKCNIEHIGCFNDKDVLNIINKTEKEDLIYKCNACWKTFSFEQLEYKKNKEGEINHFCPKCAYMTFTIWKRKEKKQKTIMKDIHYKTDKEKECDNCSGNGHPVGEFCSGCEMKDYRRNKPLNK